MTRFDEEQRLQAEMDPGLRSATGKNLETHSLERGRDIEHYELTSPKPGRPKGRAFVVQHQLDGHQRGSVVYESALPPGADVDRLLRLGALAPEVIPANSGKFVARERRGPQPNPNMPPEQKCQRGYMGGTSSSAAPEDSKTTSDNGELPEPLPVKRRAGSHDV